MLSVWQSCTTQNECAYFRIHEVESHIEANLRLGVGLTCDHVTCGPVLVKVTGAGFVNVDSYQQLVRHPAKQCSYLDRQRALC